MADEIEDTTPATDDVPAEGVDDPTPDPTPEPTPDSDLLPEDMLNRKVLVQKSGGREPMTVNEVTEYARRGWQASAGKDALINELRGKAAALESYIVGQKQQPPSAPAEGQGQAAGGDEYIDDSTRQMLNYMEKLGSKVDQIDKRFTADRQAQTAQHATAQQAQNMTRHNQALTKGIEDFKDDIDTNADVAAVISEAMNIRRNTIDPEEAGRYDSDPATLYKKAAERVIVEIRQKVDKRVESRLMELRKGLEAGDAAGVEGSGGGAPLPKSKDESPASYDEKAAHYSKRFESLRKIERAKGVALGGK